MQGIDRLQGRGLYEDITTVAWTQGPIDGLPNVERTHKVMRCPARAREEIVDTPRNLAVPEHLV